MKVVIYADGGSRGNPGIAGSGTVVYAADGATVLREIAYVVGRSSTNNVAEYHGLLRGLEAAAALGATEAEIYMDSKLVVEQMSGRWKIKHPDMQKLAIEARRLIAGLDDFSITWVPRAQNAEADALSNVAMDACAAGHPIGVVGGSEEPAAAPSQATAEAPVAVAPADAAAPLRLVLVTAAGGALDDAVVTATARLAGVYGGAAALVAGPEMDAIAGATAVGEVLSCGEVHGIDKLQGGRQGTALHKRVRAAREELEARFGGATVVAVCGSPVIASLVRQALDAAPGIVEHLVFEPGSLSVVEFGESGSLVRVVNETAHLR